MVLVTFVTGPDIVQTTASASRPSAYCYDPFNLRHMPGHPRTAQRLRSTWSC
ncbi:MAG: hypothetical protein R2844_17030 [Caldilineales bacterium]